MRYFWNIGKTLSETAFIGDCDGTGRLYRIYLSIIMIVAVRQWPGDFELQKSDSGIQARQ